MVAIARITTTLGLEHVRDQQALLPLIRKGFDVEAVHSVSDAMRVSAKALLRAIDIPVTTYQRRARKRERLHTDESDRLYRAARVFALAVDVLGSEEAAAEWFQDEVIALGGDRPMDRLQTSLGVRDVEDVLIRLSYGVHS